MAEQLESYQFINHSGRPAKYPWAEWLNGSPWRLTAGEDFTVSCKSLRASMYAAAVGRGLKLRTTVESDTSLVIQAYTPNDNGNGAAA